MSKYTMYVMMEGERVEMEDDGWAETFQRTEHEVPWPHGHPEVCDESYEWVRADMPTIQACPHTQEFYQVRDRIRAEIKARA